MTDNINGEFKMKQSEWQGYVRRALEEMTVRQMAVEKRLESIDNRILNAQLKVAGLGGISGLLVSIVFFLCVYIFTGGG